jgi:hypothetical protein
VGTCYATYFDAAAHGPDWQFPAFGLIFVAVGGVVFLLSRISPHRFGLPVLWFPSWQRYFPVLFLGFAVFWTAIASMAVFGGWAATWFAEARGQLVVVAGPVENFHPMPVTGHDTERFTVSNVHFAYSDYVVTSGFNQTSSHGGPIHEGLQVRIWYTGSSDEATIVKLEIACSQ